MKIPSEAVFIFYFFNICTDYAIGNTVTCDTSRQPFFVFFIYCKPMSRQLLNHLDVYIRTVIDHVPNGYDELNIHIPHRLA